MGNDKELPDKIKIIYEKADDYKVIYANGAWGGTTPHGELRFDLYQEYKRAPSEEVQKLDIDRDKKQAKLAGVVSSEPEQPEVIRESQVGIVLSVDKARVIAKWMTDKVEEYEEEQKKAREV